MDGSILATLFLLGSGCLAASLAVGRGEEGRLERILATLGWGPGLAAGVASLANFYGLAIGTGRPDRGGMIAILVLMIVVAWRVSRPEAKPRDTTTPCNKSSRAGLRLAWFTLIGLLVGYGWAFSRWLADRPLGSYDGMGIWTYRALQWFRAGDSFPETVGLLIESKPGYPLLLPGLVVSQFTLWGGEATTIPVATGWFFVVGLGAITTLAVSRSASPEEDAGRRRQGTDFNKSYSPPCAFNDFSTCPIASPRNRLPIRIEAGEKFSQDLHYSGPTGH